MDKKYKEFLRLVNKRNGTRSKKAIRDIDEEIKKRFEKELTIMITDSSRFTLRTKKLGVIHCIAILRKVHNALNKVITANKGKVMKEVVDNFVVAFNTPDHAVKCAIKMNIFLQKWNKKVAEHEKYNICIGIGYGKVLLFEKDFFGHEVNLTSKLGEDTAKKDEILITESTYKALKNRSGYRFKKVSKVRISGVIINYYNLLYK